MDVLLDRPTQSEIRSAVAIKAAVLRHVAEKGWSDDEVADRLDLFPAGYRNLKGQPWALDLAWRVAEGVGLDPASLVAARASQADG